MLELLHDFWFLLFATITVTSVSATLATAWHNVRKIQAEAALKQAMLHRDLSVAEMERLLHPADVPQTESEAHRSFGACLAPLALEAPVLEEVMAAFQTADLSAKCNLTQILKGIEDGGGEVDAEWLLVLARGMRAGAVARDHAAAFTARVQP